MNVSQDKKEGKDIFHTDNSLNPYPHILASAITSLSFPLPSQHMLSFKFALMCVCVYVYVCACTCVHTRALVQA